MPDHWQGNAHRYETRDEFAQLFQYKAVSLACMGLEWGLAPIPAGRRSCQRAEQLLGWQRNKAVSEDGGLELGAGFETAGFLTSSSL